MKSLTSAQESLLNKAREAGKDAYVPYSNFRVGAAVETDSGLIVTGFNIENASYGLTICGERSALVSTLTKLEKPKALAVTCLDGENLDLQNLMPCGACRQFMAEHMSDSQDIIIDGVGLMKLKDILPMAFRL